MLGFDLDLPELPPDLPLEDRALAMFADTLERSAEHDLKRREAPKLSLREFMREAWPIISPKHPFVDNWHIGAIAEHLEAVTLGQIFDLLLNIPPGCMKSLECSVLWPAWEWTRDETHKYLCGSYDEQLSIRDNRQMRDIVSSAWYQERWPVQFRKDQNAKTRYDNLKGGWRIGTSVGGRGTGLHPTRKIIDDPHNVKKSQSKVQRDEALKWLSGTMSSRGGALNAATIIIMQRLHENDASGYVLNDPELREQFVHICLPMRYEPPAWVEVNGRKQPQARMKTTPLGFQDPRTKKGELLWPELWSEEKVRKVENGLRSALGEYGVAGQMQQRPSPEEGGIFKASWFRIVDAVPADAHVVMRCRGWDGAATEDGGDWTVGARLAITNDGRIFVEDVVREQVGPGDDETLMKSTADMDGRHVKIREEQEPGSAGKKVIAAHGKVLIGYDYEGNPSTGDKVTRARPFAAQAKLGNVFLVRGDWNKQYVNELKVFPNGEHDDQVDASSTAFEEIALAPQNTVEEVRVEGL